MHYNSGNLPSFVQRVSEDIQKGWIEVNNASLDKYGEKKAFLMANAWLKRQLPKKRESTTGHDLSNGYLRCLHQPDEKDHQQVINRSHLFQIYR